MRQKWRLIFNFYHENNVAILSVHIPSLSTSFKTKAYFTRGLSGPYLYRYIYSLLYDLTISKTRILLPTLDPVFL